MKVNYDEAIQFIKYANNEGVIYKAKTAILWENIQQLEELVANSTEHFKNVEDEAFWVMTYNDAILVQGNYKEFLQLWQFYLTKVRNIVHTPNYKLK